MGSNTIIVREYLESLKEDGELDYLFPILLTVMGFKVKSTPKNSKGQSQYGKDVIAVGFNDSGQKKRFYFELKGGADRHIDDSTFTKTDGIRESILAAKDTPFVDNADPAFNALPVEIVVVHNGILKENFRPTFNGFIEREFPGHEGFQEWDIHKLTSLFNEHLFSEYLFTDEESLRLFKRTLVLLDAPENDYSDFKKLVNLQIEKIKSIKGRALKKLFATLQLLSGIISHSSKENGNMHPARECLTYLILKTWAWILKNKLEEKKPVIVEYKKLVRTHCEMLDSYFNRTLEVAKMENGLFAENGGLAEAVAYPLRCFDYLNYLVYFFQVGKHFPDFAGEMQPDKGKIFSSNCKSILMELIGNNNGCKRPLLDNHSIAILNVILFFFKDKNLTKDQVQFSGKYLTDIIDNIGLIKSMKGRFPEMNSNEKSLAEYAASGIRTRYYEDRSSLLISTLFELLAVMNASRSYRTFKDIFKQKVNLQTAHPHYDKFDIEQLLFEKHFEDEFYVEASIDLPDELSDFTDSIRKKSVKEIQYRTDKAGFPFLRTLAHIYYKNEFFVEEWRMLLPATQPQPTAIAEP